MTWPIIHQILLVVQKSISFMGMLIILSGVLLAVAQYLRYFFSTPLKAQQLNISINSIRLNLGKVLILGLEFIVAADLIGTTTAPDYYSVGILAGIVLIRTLLTYSLNKEIMSLSKEQ